MGTMDTLVRLSELFGFGRKTRAYTRDQEGSERRALTGRQARQLSLEALEPRLLLDVAGMLPNQYALLDNGAGAAAGAVLLTSGTTGGVSADVFTSNGAPDQVTGVDIVLPAHVGAGSYTVGLVFSGTSAASSPDVTFSNMNAGDTLNLGIIVDQVLDGAGLNFDNPRSALFGWTSAVYVADSNYTGPAPAAIVNGTNFGPLGDLGTTDVPASIGGGTVLTLNAGAGDVGMLTFDAVDLTGGGSLWVAQAVAGPANMAGVTVTNDTTLSNNNFDVWVAAAAAAGTTPGLVSISDGGQINVDGSGHLMIQTATFPGPAMPLGSVDLGTLNLSGTGYASVHTDSGNVGGDILGMLTVDAINITATAGVGATVTIAPDGTDDFNSAVTIGPVLMQGPDATNDVLIGTTSNSFLGGLNLSSVTNASTNLGANFWVDADQISGGALNITGTLLADNDGEIEFHIVGPVNSITGGANLTVSNDNFHGQGIGFYINGTTGPVTFGNVTNQSPNWAHVRLNFDNDNTGDALASLTIGDVSLSRPGFFNRGRFYVENWGPITGAVQVGNVVVNDPADIGLGDDARFHIYGMAGNYNWGSLTVGTITVGSDASGAATVVEMYPNGTGGITGGVTLDDVSTAGTDASVIQIGQISPASTSTLGNLTLGSFSQTSSAASGLILVARDIGNVAITGTWDINGPGGVVIMADDPLGTRDGALGDVGGNAWDVNFGAAGTITIVAADGIASFTANSVDFTVDPAVGTFTINADNDAVNNDIGAIGPFLIRQPGDHTGTGNLVTDALAFQGSVTATHGNTVTIAGGNAGTFNATSGTLDTGSWADVLIGWDSVNLVTVPRSNFTGTLAADDGILSLTVEGDDSLVNATTINANVDGDSTGTLGPVEVEGLEGGMGFHVAAPVLAADFDTFLIHHGTWNASLDNNIALAVDRQATISDVTSITLLDGGVLGVSLIIDDGIGPISITDWTPALGDAFFANIVTDADGADGGGAVGGGLDSITTSGGLTIGLLDTDGVNNTTPRTAGANLWQHENAGLIQAGESVSITTLDIGGNFEGIEIVEAVGAASPSNTITIAGPGADTYLVNGDVNRIGTQGNTAAGAGVGDNITIAGMSIIGGDLNEIDAGLGKVTITAPGLAILGGTRSTPIYIITDMGIDYILAMDGTWNAGINPATIASIVIFPVDVAPLGVRTEAAGDEASVRIIDIEGATSQVDTELKVMTRQMGTLYTANDDAPVEWDVVGIQDDISPADDGQHDFYGILVEGDARVGDWGADSNLSDGSMVLTATTPDEAVLGDVYGIEIQGTWDNAADLGLAYGSGAGTVHIFALSLAEISFGSIGRDSTPVSTPGTNQFSYDHAGGVFGDGVLPPGGIVNGSGEDLEIQAAFAPTDQLDVVIPIPDGGSITKMFIGPTGTVEFITFSDTEAEGVVDTVVIDFVLGWIQDVHLFGENIGIEFNTADPDNPATDAGTDIYYGYDQAGHLATDVTEFNENAVEFLEFSSQIGDVTLHDVTTTDAMAPSLGDVIVGYLIPVNSAADLYMPVNWINNPNDGTIDVNPLAGIYRPTVQLSASGDPLFFGAGNFSVDGSIISIVTSGGVGSIATHDTRPLITPLSVAYPFSADQGNVDPSADLLALVTDGSAGAIDIEGDAGMLVVGDRIIIDTGTDNAISPGAVGGAADTIGINGTPTFMADINVQGNLGKTGMTIGSVTTAYDYAADTEVPTVTSDEVSAPDGIAVDINVGGSLNAAVVAGKRIQVEPGENQEDDDIAGDITAANIFGDIWAGDDILGGALSAITSNGAVAGSVIWIQLAVGRNSVNTVQTDNGTASGAYTITITDPDMDAFLNNTSVGVTSVTDTEANFTDDNADNILNVPIELDSGQIFLTGGNTVVITGSLAAGDLDIYTFPIIGAGTFDFTVVFAAGDADQRLKVYDGESPATSIATVGGSAVTFSNAANTPNNINNATIDIVATGGSPGDVTADLLVNDDLINFTIDAGSGAGGSLLADVVVGRDGTGAIRDTGSNNRITADENVGSQVLGNVISAADGIDLFLVEAGAPPNDLTIVSPRPGFPGNVESDILSGVPIGATVPLETNVNDANLPIFQNDGADSIIVDNLRAGWQVDTDGDGVEANDMDSHVYATLVAAASITIGSMQIDGSVVGNDGVPGGHVAAAGMGWMGSATPFAAGSANHAVLTISGGTIVEDLSGTFSAGMLEPFDRAGASPLNPNDLGPQQPGKVYTLGELDIAYTGGVLTVGRWIQDYTGVNGTDGITLEELLAGTEGAANASFAPTFSLGATYSVSADINVVGRPYVAPQTGPGSVSPDPADGDGTAISIVALGVVQNTINFEDSADFTVVLSNVDAVTAIDTGGSTPGDPSSPSTSMPFNAGGVASGIGTANTLNVTARGNGEGGLDVDVVAAGLDFFVLIDGGPASNAPAGSNSTNPRVPDFWAAWGAGNLSGSWIAQDADPTNGLEVGDLTFALAGAGDDLSSSFIAQDDVIARTLSAQTDGAPLIAGGLDVDMIAGANVNSGLSAMGLASLFDGGAFTGRVVAGDDVGSQDTDALIVIVAQGGTSGQGSFSSNFALVSGAEDQLASADLFDNFAGWPTTEYEPDPDDVPQGNISAFVIAAYNLAGQIDADDTQRAFGAVTGGGLAGASGLTGGSFRGGIHVGAGNDLNIMEVGDNRQDGNLSATVRTSGDLDVSDMLGVTLGILVENDISGNIHVGITNPNGIGSGSLAGDVIAEGNITSDIIASGHIGVDGDMIAAGGTIHIIQAGNPVDGSSAVMGSQWLNGTFGVIASDIYAGGGFTSGGFLGAGQAIQGNLALGTNAGIGSSGFRDVNVRIGSDTDIYHLNAGLWIMFVEGGNFEGTVAEPFGTVDMIVNQGSSTVIIDVDAPTGTGTGASVRSILIGDEVLNGSNIRIEDGSLGWLGVADDVPGLSAYIDQRLTALGFDFLYGMPDFFVSSIPQEGKVEETFNNDEQRIETNISISVADTFGVPDGLHSPAGPVSPLAALVDNGLGTNADIYFEAGVQGTITVYNGDYDPDGAGPAAPWDLGNVGDIYIGVGVSGAFTIRAYDSIGEVAVNDNVNGHLQLQATTGGIGGVAVVHGSIVSNGAITMDAFGNVGESDWNENGVADGAEDLNGDGYIMPALFVAEAGVSDSQLTIQSTGGNIGDVIAEDTISGGGGYGMINALTGNVGKIHSRVGNISNVHIQSGGSLLGMIAENGQISGANIHVQDDVLQLYASSGISGTILAERGSVGNIYTETGNITGTITAGGSVGDIVARTGSVSVNVVAYDSIGSVYADSVSVTLEAKTGDVAVVNHPHTKEIWTFVFCQPLQLVKTVQTGAPLAGVTATTGDVDADITAGQDIGNVTAVLGDVSGDYVAGNDIGLLTAGNDIYHTGIQAGGDLAGLDAGDDIEEMHADVAGAVGYITAGDNVTRIHIEAGSIGDITAENGYISDVTIDSMTHIGRVSASLDIEGEFTAETGSIGNGAVAFESHAGDIDVWAIAGQDINDVIAHTGSIMSTVDTVLINVDGVVVNAWYYYDYLVGAGHMVLSVGEVDGLLRAGGSIGDLVAFDSIGNYVVQAGEDVGSISTTVGLVGAPEIIDLNDFAEFEVYLVPVDPWWVEMGMLTVVANDSIGNVSSALDIGVADQTMLLSGIETTIDSSPVVLHAVNGSIGHIESVGGSIVNIEAVANLAIGNVTASEDILGTYIVEDGPIGDIISQVGDIGAPDEPILVKANGGVEIDPYSLQYVHIVNGDVLDGVGRVYAEIGNIYADIETGGSVGAVQSSDQVLGGIAAPMGEVDVYLRVGGHVGGLSGQSVDLDPDSVILGSIGILRNIQDGGGTVQGVDIHNPLIIISEGVDYRVEVADGIASVTYAVLGGTVMFTNITYTPGATGGIAVETTTGGRMQYGAPLDSPVQVVVQEMVVNGDVADIAVEGDLLALTVAGDLVGGTLWVEGSAGDLYVAGNLGSSTSGSNPFVAANEAVRVEDLDPQVFSLDVRGTNYGLVNVTLGAWQWLTWQNTMSPDGDGDDYMTVFLGAGQANLTINNGYLETVALANGYAGNLVVVTADDHFGDSPADRTPTSLSGANWQDGVTLFLQPVMADLGVNALGTLFDNEVFEGGTVSIGRNDSAQVGRIVGEGGAGFWLINGVVEGSVGSIDASTTPSGVVGLTIAGNVGEVRGMSSYCVAGLDVRGDAGVIESLVVQNVDVNGSVGRIQATRSMSSVRVGGNAGIVDGGSLLTNVQVGGSAVSVKGGVVWDVEVGGSIGVSFADGHPETLGLGSDFTSQEVADLLGTTVSGLNSIADLGANGSRTLGGLEANILGRVSVGGGISDVTVRWWADAGAQLLNSAVDDAFIRGDWRGNWVKEDGVLIEWPGMRHG